MKKDLFSRQAGLYSQYRPLYPAELYAYIFRRVKSFRTAWDCATGNGQAAQVLSKHFEKVFATDISQKQLDEALKTDNITYSKHAAEKTSFTDHQFDLITVAQAFHWFYHEAFFREVKRVSKSGAVLAIWGYNLLTISPPIDEIIRNFYHHIVGPYWDDSRRILEKEYQTIPFPFEEANSATFDYTISWTMQHLEGYLNTWSSTQEYIRKNGHNPVPETIAEIKKYWTADTLITHFPIFLRLFYVG